MSNSFLKTSLFLFLNLAFLPLSSFGQFTKIWETRYEQAGYSSETAFKSATDANGNIYAVGMSQGPSSFPIIFKYNSSGSLLWKRQFGRGYSRTLNAVGDPIDFILDSKGTSYLLFSDGLIAKFDTDGNVLWIKSFVHFYRKPKLLQLDNTGNLYLFSNFYFYSNVYLESNYDLEVIKISGEGNQLWAKVNITPGDDDLIGGAVAEGKVVVWGVVSGNGSHRSIITYDTDGTFLWNKDESSNYLGIGKVLSGNFYVQLDNDLRGYNLTTGKLTLDYRFTEMFSYEPLTNLLSSPDGTLYAIFTKNYSIIVTKIPPDRSVTKNVYSGGINVYNYKIKDALLDPVTNKIYVAYDLNVNTSPPHYTGVIQFNPNNTSSAITPPTTKTSYSINSLSKDPNGFINLFGVFDNGDSRSDFLMMQVKSADFTKTWEATFVQENTGRNRPQAICYDSDGNTYVAGKLSSMLNGSEAGTYGVIKYNKNGSEVWRLKYLPAGVTTEDNTALAIAINNNNELFVTGVIDYSYGIPYSGPGVNLYTTKISSDGAVIWSKPYAVNAYETTVGFQVVTGSKGESYVLFSKQYVKTFFPVYQLILVKYDAMGNKVWEKIYDNSFNYDGFNSSAEDNVYPVLKMIDNEIYFFTNTLSGVEINKLDLAGNVLLRKEITPADFQQHVCGNCWINLDALDVNKAANGNIYLLISSSGGSRLVSLSPAGNILWINSGKGGNWYFNGITSGSLALNANSEAYIALTALTRMDYSRIGNDGKTIWYVKDSLDGYNRNYGLATYVFLKQDETPVFMGTNALNTASGTRDYFFQVRNKDTGTIQSVATFDSGYDPIFKNKPTYNDELAAFYKVPDKDEFVVTGSAADLMEDPSTTIVTMKFSVQSVAAGFASDKIKVIENQPVTFTDTSTGQIASWTWTFKGGTPSTYVGKTPPAITYGLAGKYPVTLVVKDNNGNSYENTLQDYITVDQKIHADFVPSNAVAGVPIGFVNKSVGPINSYAWNFEGATPSTVSEEQPKNIVFSNAGTYKVSLKVTNDMDSDAIEKEITVYQKIHADFVPSNAMVGIPIGFVNKSVGPINSYEWNFEGATPSAVSEEQPKNIVFNNAGTYKVSLKVTNDMDSDEIEKEITVLVVTGIVPSKDDPMVYPNPTNGSLLISCPAREIGNIEVYNSLGAKVAEPEPGNGEINISGLGDGIYIVKLTKVDGQTFLQKIVKH
jgi:PKD repeat protein